jgi:hypothetical protein
MDTISNASSLKGVHACRAKLDLALVCPKVALNGHLMEQSSLSATRTIHIYDFLLMFVSAIELVP